MIIVYTNERMRAKAQAHYNRMVAWAIGHEAYIATLRSSWASPRAGASLWGCFV